MKEKSSANSIINVSNITTSSIQAITHAINIFLPIIVLKEVAQLKTIPSINPIVATIPAIKINLKYLLFPTNNL